MHRSSIDRVEAKHHNLWQGNRFNTRFKQSIQQVIILFQTSHDLSSNAPAMIRLMIMMPVLTILTTELLICPSIAYFVSTFETARHIPDNPFFIICHTGLIYLVQR